MTQAYKKKLIEVAIPLEAINAASAREKSIRHGHPSTLHLWWARRPLAACRAVLFAQLVDDPSSHPDKFPTEKTVDAERKRLFAIIEELVKWENSTNEEVLEKARTEIRNSCDGHLPPVYDPFSGGASIPLEAQRLGLPAHGSDLNPVAVTIGKAMIEIPYKFKDMEPVHPGINDNSFYRNAEGLAEDIKYYGGWLNNKAKERIGKYYPNVDLTKDYGKKNATVVAWIWARTVCSPDPAFKNVKVPLVSNFILSDKKGKEVWINPKIDKITKKISWKICHGGSTEELKKAKLGTSLGKRQAFTCIMSNTPISYDYIRKEGQKGEIGQQLIAIIADGKNGRMYLDPKDDHISAAQVEKPSNLPFVRLQGKTRVNVSNYGMETFSDLFTNRQLLALSTFGELINDVRHQIIENGQNSNLPKDEKSLNSNGKGLYAYAEAVSLYLAFAIDRLADANSSISTWSSSGFIRFTFARQAIPMTWDFAECNIFSSSTGNFQGAVNWVWKALLGFSPNSAGFVRQGDAQTVKLPTGAVISTDPPYYDNIQYADLSDYFYFWLRENIKDIYSDLSATLAVPKEEELVASPHRHKGKGLAERHFLDGMTKAISNFAVQSSTEFPAAIYYAFKQTEINQSGLSSTGWATFLEAVIRSGYTIVGTWPVRTERSARTIATGKNALANSVVLVCRQKNSFAESITRAEFIRILKNELPPAIIDLQTANLSPADIPQAAIGPGIAVFSRFKSILESDDSPMTVRTALQLINMELDAFLNDIQGEFDPDTRFAATWFEQNGYEKGDFGAANSLATARGISVDSVKHAGIIESSAGKVRILKREELDPNWEPNSDSHLTVWECCQYLVREYEDGGETAAAMLVKKIGYEKAEALKDLAYYLYDICSNKRQDAKEAISYNALIAGWNDIMRMANSIHDTDTTRQASLF